MRLLAVVCAPNKLRYRCFSNISNCLVEGTVGRRKNDFRLAHLQSIIGKVGTKGKFFVQHQLISYTAYTSRSDTTCYTISRPVWRARVRVYKGSRVNKTQSFTIEHIMQYTHRLCLLRQYFTPRRTEVAELWSTRIFDSKVHQLVTAPSERALLLM